jgi:hypothetical protein
MRSLSRLSVLGLLVAFGTAEKARAGTIVSDTTVGSTFANSGSLEWAQAFTTPNTGAHWNNITFNFVATGGTPVSNGTAYLFTSLSPSTQAYSGTATALSSPATAALPNYIAASISLSGGKEIFASSVVLNPGTTYYIYESNPLASGTTLNVDTGLFPNPPGVTFFSAGGGTFGSSGAHSADFNVSGDFIDIPELDAGSAIGAMSVLAMGVAMINSRRRARKQAA